MDACDVLIVGGGPAGAACAWRLRQAGLDTVVTDSAAFPRDKVCAGWITPQVVDDLAIDLDDYRKSRVLQPIVGFRVGTVGSNAARDISYHHPVSFAIRRCEFDHYLLARAGARLSCGRRVTRILRKGDRWIVDDAFETPMLVGAGGHWCPVARLLNHPSREDMVVAAQESEVLLDRRESSRCRVEPGIVEIYFLADLSGYGWCFRKGDYLNVGFGRYGARALPKAANEFVRFLTAAGRVPPDLPYCWRGHAYATASRARVADQGVILVGDAAGVADPRSGEGIRQAIESGLLGGSAIAAATGCYTADRFASYTAAIRRRFNGPATSSPKIWDRLRIGRTARIAAGLLRVDWFVRRIVLERWFLHVSEPPLA